MSAGIAIAVIVGLFIVFGTLALGDRKRGCHDCPGAGQGGCGTCDKEEAS